MTKLSLKERAALHQIKRENKLNELLSNLQNISGAMLTAEDTNIHYIISPSNRYEGYYQLTTFIHNKPYSHTQEPTINELIKSNIGELLNYTIKEAI